MAIKNLLVVVDHSEQSAARVDAAILLAVTHDAHLTGLFVAAPPSSAGRWIWRASAQRRNGGRCGATPRK
jgi:hypothetical protein